MRQEVMGFWDGSGISWTIHKKNLHFAPDRYPLQHLITYFLHGHETVKQTDRQTDVRFTALLNSPSCARDLNNGTRLMPSSHRPPQTQQNSRVCVVSGLAV